MSEPVRDEKWFLRAEKYSQALQAEIEATHFACWRLELRELLEDDDWDDEDGPPPGWHATELN